MKSQHWKHIVFFGKLLGKRKKCAYCGPVTLILTFFVFFEYIGPSGHLSVILFFFRKVKLMLYISSIYKNNLYK